MLSALRLGNFKAFATTQQIPIRPITLIFGSNSAGKSSIIHSLAMAHEAMNTRKLDIATPRIGGSSIDLGGFRQYVHRRDSSRNVILGFEIDVERVGKLAQFDLDVLKSAERFTVTLSFGISQNDQGRPLRGLSPSLTAYEVETDGTVLLRMSRRPDGRLQLDQFQQDHMVFRRIASQVAGETGPAEIGRVAENPALAIAATPKGLFPSQVRSEAGQAGIVVSVIGYFVSMLNACAEKILHRLSYLGPLRSYPPRHLAFPDSTEVNWTAGGGSAWDRVRRSRNLRACVNSWLKSPERLQTPYELTLRKLIAPKSAQSALAAGLDTVFSRLVRDTDESSADFGEDVLAPSRWDRDAFVDILATRLEKDRTLESESDLVLVDRLTTTEVSHRDVGIGISQVLPVLVSAYGSRERMIAIEQPEIHLHPRLQAEIADVFIESALGGRNNVFLLETHSEHLILRVLRRIRETAEGRLPVGMTPISPKDVAVLSVMPDRNGALVVEIPVTSDGEFGGLWPGGFFPERAKEMV
jgi:AAA ATPase domain